MESLGLYGHLKQSFLKDTRTRRSDYVWLVIFSLLLCILTAGVWHPMPDSGLYFSQAKTIASSGGLWAYFQTRWIASPGYPLLISPFFLFDPLPLTALTFFHAIITAIYMFGVYVWASRFTFKTAILIAATATLHGSIWQYCFTTTTEAPFMASMIWSVVALTFWLDHRETKAGKQAFFIAVILMTLCSQFRPAGIMIMLGGVWVIFLQDRQNKRTLGQSLGVIFCWIAIPSCLVGLFLLHESYYSNHGLMGTYLSGLVPQQHQTLWELLSSGANKRIGDFGRLMIPGMVKAYSKHENWLHITMLFYIPIFAGVVWAWFKIVSKKYDVLLWGLLPYLALHINYAHFSDGTRFMTPMLPVIMLLAWKLLGHVKKIQHNGMLILCVLHAGFVIGLAIREQPTLIAIEKQWESAAICSDIISKDPGLTYGLKDANYIELQIRILSQLVVHRKRTLQKTLEAPPKWVISRKMDAIPDYHIHWSNNEFTLQKRNLLLPKTE